MAVTTIPFDAAPFLDDEAAQAEYLSDALATGDAAVVAHALGVLARAQGMTDVARQSGLQRENLYRALSDTGRPELATVLGVIRAMGLKLAAMPAGAP
ncbi:addiction module antidote protein [Sandarakinorhabdus sp.]|jgi:probable addiction module antidote protein|uniref:addiction module antidote protein n=1 Tax=Sandarakinorhabdus sp. TaxID=1916663 RepID=UPI003341A45C